MDAPAPAPEALPEPPAAQPSSASMFGGLRLPGLPAAPARPALPIDKPAYYTDLKALKDHLLDVICEHELIARERVTRKRRLQKAAATLSAPSSPECSPGANRRRSSLALGGMPLNVVGAALRELSPGSSQRRGRRGRRGRGHGGCGSVLCGWWHARA